MFAHWFRTQTSPAVGNFEDAFYVHADENVAAASLEESDHLHTHTHTHTHSIIYKTTRVLL